MYSKVPTRKMETASGNFLRDRLCPLNVQAGISHLSLAPAHPTPATMGYTVSSTQQAACKHGCIK